MTVDEVVSPPIASYIGEVQDRRAAPRFIRTATPKTVRERGLFQSHNGLVARSQPTFLFRAENLVRRTPLPPPTIRQDDSRLFSPPTDIQQAPPLPSSVRIAALWESMQRRMASEERVREEVDRTGFRGVRRRTFPAIAASEVRHLTALKTGGSMNLVLTAVPCCSLLGTDAVPAAIRIDVLGQPSAPAWLPRTQGQGRGQSCGQGENHPTPSLAGSTACATAQDFARLLSGAERVCITGPLPSTTTSAITITITPTTASITDSISSSCITGTESTVAIASAETYTSAAAEGYSTGPGLPCSPQAGASESLGQGAACRSSLERQAGQGEGLGAESTR